MIYISSPARANEKRATRKPLRLHTPQNHQRNQRHRHICTHRLLCQTAHDHIRPTATSACKTQERSQILTQRNRPYMQTNILHRHIAQKKLVTTRERQPESIFTTIHPRHRHIQQHLPHLQHITQQLLIFTPAIPFLAKGNRMAAFFIPYQKPKTALTLQQQKKRKTLIETIAPHLQAGRKIKTGKQNNHHKNRNSKAFLALFRPFNNIRVRPRK